MSFETLFDGFCVIHSPSLAAERRTHFERELARIGVRKYTVVEPPLIEDADERLLKFEESNMLLAKRRLSLCEAQKICVDYAQNRNWKNVVIMEDDVVFRNEFQKWWVEVENDPNLNQWDIFFLYRWSGKLLAEPHQVALVPISYTVCTHCFAICDRVYSIYKKALDYSILKGLASDSYSTFHYLHEHNVRIFATTKNLAGQVSGFGSTISAECDVMRTVSLEDNFRVKDPRLFYRWIFFLKKIILKIQLLKCRMM